MSCPNCGSVKVQEKNSNEPLLYGNPNAVPLQLSLPIRYCLDCGEQWSDWRGEPAQALAVHKFHAGGAAIASALIRALKLIDDMMPGVRHIALQDYKELNDVPLAAIAALKKAGVELPRKEKE